MMWLKVTLVLSIAGLTLEVGQAAQLASGTCPKGWFADQRLPGECYYFSTSDNTWAGARSHCTSMGATLTSIRDQQEWDIIRKQASSTFYYVGLNNVHHGTRTATWIDGTPWTSFHKGLWASGEPNNSGGDERCGELRPSGFNDIRCTARYRYICKSGCVRGYYWHVSANRCNACPAGTYQPNTSNRDDLESCQSCPLGRYCTSSGLGAPTGACTTPGYYCPMGSKSPTQHTCPRNWYCPGNTLGPVMCIAGTTSEPGAKSQSDCKGETTTPMPTTTPTTTPVTTQPVEVSTLKGSTVEGSTGEPGTVPPTTVVCTPGHYADGSHCEPCPVGTFQSADTLNENPRLCQSCTAGYYCSRKGLAAPEGRCSAGYYCPQGSTSVKSVFCPENFFCIQGSRAPAQCNSGYYSAPGSVGPSDCTSANGRNCEPGWYWHNSKNHCHKCPVGTYQPTHAHGRDVQICQSCPLSYYCASEGLAEPTGRCIAPGYYCPMKSTSQTFKQCPRDFFCTGNSTSPTPCPGATNSEPGARSKSECNAVAPVTCPDGTYINGTSCADCPKGTYLPPSTTGTECRPCDAGKYCTHPKSTAVSGTCSARYYCPQGSTHPTSVICPQDHYCPGGAGAPTKCPDDKVSLEGSYQESDCNIAMKDCGPGYYTNGQSCSPCPIGTYQSGWTKGRGLLQVCLSCDAGKYCKKTGLAAPSGLCAPGFYCPARSGTRTHSICPAGHYCIVGSAFPIACPLGFTSAEGSTTLYECTSSRLPCSKGYYIDDKRCIPCPPGTHKSTVGDSACKECPTGSFCSRQANIQPSGKCQAGYYCPGGSDNPNQHLCPKDHYCVAGCGVPVPCPSGTRSYPGSSSSGHCNRNVPNECSPGSYFHQNQKCNPCPAGTYKPEKSRHGFEACIPCPEGQYCEHPGASRPTGPCPAGYFCPLASSSPGAIICPPNHYCPTATPGPIRCTGGKRTLPGSTAC